MSFAWHEIRDQLTAASTTFKFQRDFDTIQRSQVALTSYNDPAAVLDALHRKSADPDKKNRVLSALVMAAQGDDPAADTALTLLLLALWPGLDAIRRRSVSRKLGTIDEIASDLLARTVEAVRSLNLCRVSWIAATVLRNIERDMIRARQRDHVLQTSVDIDALSNIPADNPAPDTAMQCRCDLFRLVGEDAGLVRAVVLHGFSQVEVAAVLGISPDAARKRYQRALHRLRKVFEKNFDGAVP